LQVPKLNGTEISPNLNQKKAEVCLKTPAKRRRLASFRPELKPKGSVEPRRNASHAKPPCRGGSGEAAVPPVLSITQKSLKARYIRVSAFRCLKFSTSKGFRRLQFQQTSGSFDVNIAIFLVTRLCLVTGLQRLCLVMISEFMRQSLTPGITRQSQVTRLSG